MVFNRFVEVGRVALGNYGPAEGNLCVIIDVLDHNKALVDGGSMGLARQKMSFKRLSLTDIKVDCPRSARTKNLNKAIAAADVQGNWEKTSWAKKRASKAARANLNDLDRFKVMVLRKQRSAIKRGNWRSMPKAMRTKTKKKFDKKGKPL